MTSRENAILLLYDKLMVFEAARGSFYDKSSFFISRSTPRQIFILGRRS